MKHFKLALIGLAAAGAALFTAPAPAEAGFRHHGYGHHGYHRGFHHGYRGYGFQRRWHPGFHRGYGFYHRPYVRRVGYYPAYYRRPFVRRVVVARPYYPVYYQRPVVRVVHRPFYGGGYGRPWGMRHVGYGYGGRFGGGFHHRRWW